MIFLKNKKIIGAVSLLVLFWLIMPKPALAQLDCLSNLTDCITDALLSIINLIVDFVGMILIGIAASIVNFVFNFQGFIKVPLVQTGWTLSRDIANMAFILIMLAMAFGTILRFESYGWKKLLPRLIIMALLINFSLMIAGGIIDVANSIAKFFISGGGDNNVGDMIMSSIRAGSIAQIRNNISSVGAAVNALIMASIIQLIFYIIIAFLLFALGFMMIIRIVKLWIMIILAPFSWIGWAIPFTSGSLKKWWSDFLHQAFFPALMGFFIFLGTLAGSTLNGTDFDKFSKDVGGFWGALLPTTLFSSIMQFIVVVFILFMGLNMANSWSNGAGKAMVKLAGDGQKWAKQKAWSYTKKQTGKLAEGALYGKDATTGQRTQPRGLVKQIASIPILGKSLRAPIAMAEQRKKQVTEIEKKYENQSNRSLDLLWASAGADDRIAMANIKAKRGQLKATPGLVSKDQIGATMQRATALGMEKDMMIAAPDIAIEYNVVNNNTVATVDRVEKVFKELKPEDVKKVADGVWDRLNANPATTPYFNRIMETALKNWGSRHLANMADAGQKDNIRGVEAYIRSLGASVTDRLAALETLAGNQKLTHYLQASPGGADIIDLN